MSTKPAIPRTTDVLTGLDPAISVPLTNRTPDKDHSGPPPEFTLIARHFRPLAAPGGLGLLDDAALLTPPPGQQLVVTADALVAGVHFLPQDPPDLIARKLLRVNLSDLAAMGAAPLAYLLTISAPRNTPDSWFAAFSQGLARDQKEFGIALLGGDTTHTTGPLCLSLTAIGHVAPGKAIRRNGARDGDGLWVTGTIGDGALGLAALQGRLPDPDGYLATRYHLPQPRLGLLGPHRVCAAMDISDGLVQDAGHLARAGGIAVEIDASLVPLSPAARAAGPDWLETCLTGGDDYELLMATPPGRSPGFPATRIGRFTAGEGVRVLSANGQPMPLSQTGWSHF